MKKIIRTTSVLMAVAVLTSTVALPAYTAFDSPKNPAVTAQNLTISNPQTMVVTAEAASENLVRDSYDVEKLQQKAIANVQSEKSAAYTAQKVNMSLVAPGSGQVRWPVNMSQVSLGQGFGVQRGNHVHIGFDFLGVQGTPIFAAVSGVVTVAAASNYYYGFGHAVRIESNINGQAVTTIYAHMMNGGVLVSAGQTVRAGQLIGLMGSTGMSTANHLHFEVHLNGIPVDPFAWLKQNAG